MRLTTPSDGCCSYAAIGASKPPHQILDTAFAEDDHPWIEQNPRATVVVMVLRRIAYTLLTLWRGVSLRSDEQRARPWRDLMRDILLAAVTATLHQLRGLRDHRLP
ncbi:MAG: hypothetical protein U0263_16695 [Polyangiaceae bacterium]